MNSKEWFQYSCAAFMLLTGATLSFISFFTRGDVTDNVLFYVGECIMFAGGIFGVTIYFNSKSKTMFNELRKELTNIVKGSHEKEKQEKQEEDTNNG